ncbi:MAG: GDP-L-fucose synthase [Desulfovibrio sp.]|nr:GDP-L-fucose synthase [Desulfovibrio sp.]
MEKDAKIYVAGHRGLVGSALCRELAAQGYRNVVTADRDRVDLLYPRETEAFLLTERPRYVFLAAAKVGGIRANATYPGDFIRDNLRIQCNVIHGAWLAEVRKLLFLGSSCIYPRLCPQPIREEYLMTGALEETNAPYAIAKIAGITMCQSYRNQYGLDAISVMPTNLYGPGDKFDDLDGHVLPALLLRFAHAVATDSPTVTIWGTGEPRREFLHVDDLAKACLLCMHRYSEDAPINIGCGEDHTIMELARTIADTVGFKGRICTDPSMPDGTPRKLLDITKISKLGWKPQVELSEGIRQIYNEILHNGVLDNYINKHKS